MDARTGRWRACALVEGLAWMLAACDAAPNASPTMSAAPGPPTIVSPPPAPPPASPVHPLRLLFGGDVIPHRPSLVEPAAIERALAPLRGLFSSADAVAVNFEAATGDVPAKASRLVYAAPPAWLGAVSKAGVTAVGLANNHACDLGVSGLDASLEAAASAKLSAMGAGGGDPWQPRVLAEAGGKRVCAVAWTTVMNGVTSCAKSSRLAFAPADARGKARVDRALAEARARCDAVVAVVHGGAEYAPQTTQIVDQAASAAEAGADAVVVHHPHVASPVVVHATKDGRRVPIFASVGNLATNQGESWKASMFPVLPEDRRLVCVNGWTRLGVLADLTFRFDDPAGARLDWGFHLVWIDNQHAEDRSVVVPRIDSRPLDPHADQAIVARLREDRVGPVALFDDACWIEAGGAGDARCHGAVGQSGAPDGAGVRGSPWSEKSASSSRSPVSTVTTAARRSSRAPSATPASR